MLILLGYQAPSKLSCDYKHKSGQILATVKPFPNLNSKSQMEQIVEPRISMDCPAVPSLRVEWEPSEK